MNIIGPSVALKVMVLAVGSVGISIEKAYADHIGLVIGNIVFDADGSYSVMLSIDATEVKRNGKGVEQISEEFVRSELEFQFDGQSFSPNFGEFVKAVQKNPSATARPITQCIGQAIGKIPPDAQIFRLKVDSDKAVTLILVAHAGGVQRDREILKSGELSRPIDLSFASGSLVSGKEDVGRFVRVTLIVLVLGIGGICILLLNKRKRLR